MIRPLMLACVSAIFGIVAPSAIPMWEFLKKEEKTSYIYSLFANEVDEYCQTTQDKNCNHDLLKYGLKKLREMSEEELDELDPYQRDAGSLIWDTLMNGHIVKSNFKRKSSTTPKPNSYEDDLSFGVTDDFGSQSEESAKIENYEFVDPPNGFVFVPNIQPGSALETDYPKNAEAQSSDATPSAQTHYYSSNALNPSKTKNTIYSENKTKKPITNLEKDYSTELPFENILHPKKDEKQEQSEEGLNFDGEAPKVTLTGPAVVRVYPDGTPVTETAPKVPQDEDLYQYRLQHIKLPKL